MRSEQKTAQRRARQIAQIREDILRAAARALAHRGFETATMQDIAKEAGYTVVSLYAYFKSKDEIVDGLIAQLTRELLQVFEAPSPPDFTFAQRLRALVERLLDLAQRWREAFAVFLTIKPHLARRASRKHPAPDLFVRRLAAWIEANARGNDIGARQPEDVAYLLKGILHALFVQWLHQGARVRVADRAQMVVDTLLYGLSPTQRGPEPDLEEQRP